MREHQIKKLEETFFNLPKLIFLSPSNPLSFFPQVKEKEQRILAMKECYLSLFSFSIIFLYFYALDLSEKINK